MIVTVIRLAMSLILLAASIALRLALIFGTLIAWALTAIASQVSHFVQQRHSQPQTPSRSFLQGKQPEAPRAQGEYVPRVIHRKPRR